MSILIFVSYARNKDKKLWEALETTLAITRSNDKVKLWDPYNDIISGQVRQKEIDEHLQKAQIFLLLLSPDFFVDEDCLQQMRQAFAIKKQAKELIYIVPILLRPCLWQRDGIEDVQILPRKEIPVTGWPDRDTVLLDIAQEIHAIIKYIDKNGSDTSATTPAQPPQASTYNFQARQGEDVDLGIIIALKEEFAVLFAEIGPGSKAVRDPQTNEIYYRFERSSTVAARPYRCIATFIGGMGPTRAALQAEKMIARWNPSTLVLPGIAASLSASAKLGDIVVADQVDGYMENAKANPTTDQQGYNLAFSGEVYRTSSTLLKEVQNFEFSAPHIFQAWQAGTEAMQHELLEAERYELISKKLLRKQAQVIDGHIASGPVVDAAQAFTNWLSKRDRKYLALEMEAMGVMAAVYNQASTKNTGTLILRAISDYGNEEKSKLDTTGEGALRRYAMHNAIQLLWSFLDAGILSQNL